VKGPRACETGGWGCITLRWTETSELGPEPIRLIRSSVRAIALAD